MNTELTISPDFVIRPLETMAEVEIFYYLNARAFQPDEDFETVYTRRLDYRQKGRAKWSIHHE